MEEMIAHLLKPCPIQIALLRKVILIAVLATKIANVGDMPLDIELFFHRPPKKMIPKNHSKIKTRGLQSLQSVGHDF
jgi:hypothetical protein